MPALPDLLRLVIPMMDKPKIVGDTPVIRRLEVAYVPSDVFVFFWANVQPALIPNENFELLRGYNPIWPYPASLTDRPDAVMVHSMMFNPKAYGGEWLHQTLIDSNQDHPKLEQDPDEDMAIWLFNDPIAA